MLDHLKHFRSIESRIESFLKTFLFHVFKHFSKLFLSLFDWSRHPTNFLSLSSDLFARFFSPKADKTILPFLFHLFSSFMHFSHAYSGNFKLKDFWDFCFLKPFLSKLINGFLLWDAINMILVI